MTIVKFEIEMDTDVNIDDDLLDDDVTEDKKIDILKGNIKDTLEELAMKGFRDMDLYMNINRAVKEMDGTSIKVHLDESKLEKLAKSIMENYPEASLNLKCLSYSYEMGRYVFLDFEDKRTYNIEIRNISLVIPIFLQMVNDRKLNFRDIDIGKLLRFDGGDWDNEMIDALVQLAIFKEVRYS